MYLYDLGGAARDFDFDGGGAEVLREARWGVVDGVRGHAGVVLSARQTERDRERHKQTEIGSG
jgi:hypothetical protein